MMNDLMFFSKFNPTLHFPSTATYKASSYNSGFASANVQDKADSSFNNSPRELKVDEYSEVSSIPFLQRHAISVPKRKQIRKRVNKSKNQSIIPSDVMPQLVQATYDSKMSRQNSDFTLKMMKNRVDRLKFEHDRANKEIRQIKERAKFVIETRNKYKYLI